MDLQVYFNVGLGLICGGLGWFANTLWSAQQKLREDLTSLHIKLTQDYVPNTRLDAVMREINDNIRRILDKLDEKAEK